MRILPRFLEGTARSSRLGFGYIVAPVPISAGVAGVANAGKVPLMLWPSRVVAYRRFGNVGRLSADKCKIEPSQPRP
jgi:hypothetical protein